MPTNNPAVDYDVFTLFREIQQRECFLTFDSLYPGGAIADNERTGAGHAKLPAVSLLRMFCPQQYLVVDGDHSTDGISRLSHTRSLSLNTRAADITPHGAVSMILLLVMCSRIVT